jgi:predicted amidophosphoribosyltransferase
MFAELLNILFPPICPLCGFHIVEAGGGEEAGLCEACLASIKRIEGPVCTVCGTPFASGAGPDHPCGVCMGSRKPFIKAGLVETFDVVIPVPLHKDRLRERGFNQSLLLAREVARGPGLQVDYKSLKRTRPTKPQADLKTEERRKNVRDAFEVKSPEGVRKKKVLLVDDVYTTGATVSECARVLKREKCKVFVLTLARAVSL